MGIVKMKPVELYAAYGSNMNLGQMKYRCPTAEVYSTGVIKNCELQFKGMPYSAYATIGTHKGSEVPVLLWKLKHDDELSLDRYEGYPNHYFKQIVNVKVQDRTVSAMAYVMNLNRNFGIPSTEYLKIIAEGYQSCGFDTDILINAIKYSGEMLNQSIDRDSQQMQFRF